MVDVEEIDDEGKPLRYDESFYHQPKPTFEDRFRRLVSCWQYCHMNLLIWMTLIFGMCIFVLGVLVLNGNKEAGKPREPQCNRLFNWVMYFVIINGVNTIWYSIEEGFRVPKFQPDPTSPNGLKETPLHEQNSLAYVYVRVFRLIVHFVLTLVFFVVGYEIIKNSKCTGHSDLWLYFKCFWWLLVVVYGFLCLLILCGGFVACCTLCCGRRHPRREDEP